MQKESNPPSKTQRSRAPTERVSKAQRAKKRGGERDSARVKTKKIANDPLIGQVIGGCHIAGLLGRGAMGAVYKANQLSLDREVAIKTIRDGLLNEEQLFVRFRQEARTVSKFSTPHVVQIHEVGLDKGIHFLVMEFVDGGNLQTYTEKQADGVLGTKDAVRFMAQCAMGLLEAERLRIVHRDIKPENLLLDASLKLKITDFGIAKLLNSAVHMTIDASILGTPMYMSPEQAQGKPLNHRSDIYSLGATFYQLLTGQRPVSGRTALEILQRKLKIKQLSPIKARPTVSRSLNNVIEKMTALDPADRYASFAEILTDLSRVVEGRPTSKLSGRRRRTRLRKVLSLGAVTIALTALGVLTLPSFTPLHDDSRSQASPGAGAQTSLAVERPPAGNVPGTTSTASPASETPTATPGTSPTTPATSPEPESKEPLRADPTTAGIVVNETSIWSVDKTRETMATLRGRLRARPDPEIVVRAEALLETLPRGHPLAREVFDDLEALMADARLGATLRKALDALPTPAASSVAVPFDALSRYWADVSAVLEERRTETEELSSWIAETRQRYATELTGEVRGAFARLVDEAGKLSERVERGESTLADLRALLDVADRSVANLRAAFPVAVPHIESSPQARELARLRRFSEARKELDERVAAIDASLNSLGARLRGLRSSSSWTSELERDATTRLEALAAEAAAVREGAPAPALGPLEAELAALGRLREQWSKHVASLQTAAALLAERRLAEASPLVDALAADGLSDTDSARFVEGHSALMKGFAALDTLRLATAREELEAAARHLSTWPASADWARTCAARIEALQTLVADMSPVHGGEVLSPRASQTTTIAGFYIDRTETTIAEFLAFLEAQSRVRFEDVRSLWASEDVFRRSLHKPAYLEEILHVDERWPIEEVSYHQARAFLLSRGKDLPTLDEWWLAAKGPLVGDRHRFKFPVYRNSIWQGKRVPCRVTRGGEARAFEGGEPVRHLTGNVAEWTRLESDDARRAVVVGGRYLDTDDRYFTGEKRDTMDIDDTRRGYGFRGVVRPAEFLGDLMPRAAAR